MTGSGSSRSSPERQARPDAWQAALRLIDYRARTRVELERKLAERGFPGAEIGEALARLEASGLVDDGEYARSWAETAARCKRMGPARIEAELRRRGIGRELAQRAASAAFAEVGEEERAREAARRAVSRGGDPGDEAAARRMVGYLLRRGFSREVAMKVLRDLRAS